MTVERFELRTPFIDLLQLLKATGNAATGGDAKWMVEEGRITVNEENEPEFRKRRKIRAGDVVRIDDQIQIEVFLVDSQKD
ncbi:MAG: RNA-binding S4 domain-containing protein [Flavobacteriales bacterium]